MEPGNLATVDKVRMRLERIFRHRVVRLLRVVLPILVIVLIAVPGWNYYARIAHKAASPRTEAKLPLGVSVRTDGFTHLSSEGGRTRFTVHAKQSLGYKDDKYILQDVDVIVYGATEQDPARNIRGKNCTYDQATNNFTCRGNVEVDLDEHTIVRTDNLIYNHQDGIVIAPESATIERDGGRGRSDSFEYIMNTGLLKLKGNVYIQTQDHVEVETGAALFQQKENWITMSSGVFIKSPNGWIRGSAGRVDLEPGTYKPKLITVENNVTAESRPVAQKEVWKLRAGWMEAVVSPSGSVQQVKTREDVEIEKISTDAPQRLSGARVDAILKDGKVDEIEANDKSRMIMGSDRTIESSRIWTNASGSMRTAENSVLIVGDSTIRGREFVIENGAEFVTFNTARRATLKTQNDQESASDQTRARFESRTNTLLELVQTGNFQFRTPQYQGRAQSGRFEEGGTVVVLEGSPVVNDSQKRLEASQIRVNQKDNSFVATTNVSTLMNSSGEGNDRVLVKSSRAEGGANSMLYLGNVQLWRGDAYIRTDRLNASGQGQQNTSVHAEGGPGGRVQSYLQNIRATSDTLDYDDARGVIRYLGHVHAQKQDMILDTPDLTATLQSGNVSQIVATGGVTATRTDQQGSGERAVYDAATDVVTLTGNNAQVRDKERGLIQGSSVTMKNKGQTAQADGGDGKRTITKHPIKTDKR